MRYRIIIDRAALERDEPAIHVIDNEFGYRQNFRTVALPEGGTIIQADEPLQDGSRIWIEADDVRIERI